MANFGWSYPAGCSGPPEGPLEPVCICGHLESDHDPEAGDRCLECTVCSKFEPAPEPAVEDPGPEDYDLELFPDVDDGGVSDVEVDRLPGDEERG